ncbi:MAG: fatty acid desaturase [Gammaproteobacteria bacterium]|nr:fatty acid desaturase [Gammaproteobacteria bacterium]
MNSVAAITKQKIAPSFRNAVPHFLPVTVFPLIFLAAAYGGWWIAAPFVFFMTVGPLDLALGEDGRNMDIKETREHPLFWYILPVWAWALLWPAAFVFTLWQIFLVGHLDLWEEILLAFVLAVEGQGVFIIGHELIHRRTSWERYVGEFLLASVSYPHYSTEHFYVHHAHVGTPKDAGSARKGQSFWNYFPRELASNLRGAWAVERNRMARRQLPAWHFSNLFWRYGLETAAWYLFIYWAGGAVAVLIFMVLCLGIVFSMKISNYIQHYGLRRIQLPNGRFERVLPRHSWGADYQYSNWMFFNMQRHPDHHVAAGRRYPLLQHYGTDESPLLPGSYGTMFNLALRPRRWFEKMDPLVDAWREHFYPEIKDWSAYDSPVSEMCPKDFSTIAEVYATAPRLARAIERDPALLDQLQDKEFTDLEIPPGFGPDPDFERTARQGLARVYWTYELGVVEMQDQIAEIPVKDAADAAETVRNWSNGKVFQIGMHTLRGNLKPVEAGIALANVAESSINAILRAVVEDVAERGQLPDRGGMAAIVLGDLASREMVPRTPLDILFVHDSSPSDALYRTLCGRFQQMLHTLTRNSLLFEPSEGGKVPRDIYAMEDFVQHFQSAPPEEILKLTRSRRIFTCGETGAGQRFEDARRAVLFRDSTRKALLQLLRAGTGNAPEAGCPLTADIRQGLQEIERTVQLLHWTGPGAIPENRSPDPAISLLEAGGDPDRLPPALAKQLASAAMMWRNLQGIQHLIMENGTPIDSLPDPVKSAMARSCDQADFEQLTTAVRDAAAITRTGLEAMLRAGTP